MRKGNKKNNIKAWQTRDIFCKTAVSQPLFGISAHPDFTHATGKPSPPLAQCGWKIIERMGCSGKHVRSFGRTTASRHLPADDSKRTPMHLQEIRQKLKNYHHLLDRCVADLNEKHASLVQMDLFAVEFLRQQLATQHVKHSHRLAHRVIDTNNVANCY